jgi:3-deoxy-7-phosphoheptulonate synthase
MTAWTPTSYLTRTAAQAVTYPSPRALEGALETLRVLPPLVTSWEIERLKALLADAQDGKRFVLQGGDCAETFADCRSSVISAKLKILLQMSLVLVQGAQRPVVRIGRFAGQYAKPRSTATETRLVRGESITLPNYFGDLVNRAAFDAASRAPDPELLLAGYHHAAMTLNFVRSLAAGGFADMHHPEQWDLSFSKSASLPADLRAEYRRASEQLGAGLRFMEALGETSLDELTRVELFTSHEGLHLPYEAALTRRVPRREGYYCLSAHLPWIGERTRAIDGAHVELYRGVQNPIGIKLGPTATRDEVLALIEALNPSDERGKIVLITRMGSARVTSALPPLLEAVRDGGRRVLWVCDPMHGNTRVLPSGKKTRAFDDILAEIERTAEAHRSVGTLFGGVHFELTGDDVTECTGGADALTEADLDTAYETACDPRLNYRQSLEMAFLLARTLRGS